MKKILSVLLCSAALGTVRAENPKTPATDAVKSMERATFAGGCFWCMQPPFDRLKGVLSTVVGYTGGAQADPTYEQVSAGGTGHAESIEISFDPSRIGYSELLEVFWKNTDPTTPDRQFCDSGRQYRTAIFYHSEEQKRLAEASRDRIERSGVLGRPVVTEIAAATAFYPAEEYHQKYYLKNPVRYKFYRYNCGRDQTLKRIWGAEPAH